MNVKGMHNIYSAHAHTHSGDTPNIFPAAENTGSMKRIWQTQTSKLEHERKVCARGSGRLSDLSYVYAYGDATIRLYVRSARI